MITKDPSELLLADPGAGCQMRAGHRLGPAGPALAACEQPRLKVEGTLT